MNSLSFNSFTTAFFALTTVALISACSPKASTEDSAAQTKAIVDQAVAEAKKQILVEQEAAKTAEPANPDTSIVKQETPAATTSHPAVAKPKQHQTAPAHTTAATTISNSSAAAKESQPAPAKMICTTCGVVVAINEIESEGKGSGLGVVAGGVVGGLLGNQVGNGSGRDLATIAGAVGGAIAGNKIEKNSKKTKHYEVIVQMETGEERVISLPSPPGVVKGNAVKVENDVIVKQ